MKYDSKYLCDALRIDPSNVEEIHDVATDGGLVIHVTMAKGRAYCPSCKSDSLRSLGFVTRAVKHPFLFKEKTEFVIRERRYRCRSCGATFTARIDMASPRKRVSHELEMAAIEELMEPSSTLKLVAKRLKVTPTTVMNIFDRLCDFPRKRMPRVLCIDECYGKGQFSEPYCLVMLDFEAKKVVDVLEGRGIAGLRKYFFESVREEERAQVDVICIDMWEPYLSIAESYFKNAVVCIDSFHVMENLRNAVDRIRCRIMRGCPSGSDQYWLLKHCDKMLYLPKLKPWGQRRRIAKFQGYRNDYELQCQLLSLSPDLRTAWGFYRAYSSMNSTAKSDDEAAPVFDGLMRDPEAARIPELASFQSLMARWREWILNSFLFIGGRRISNGPIEGMNSEFKKIMRVSNGVSNFRRFRARLMLIYNKEVSLSPKKG